MKLFTAISFITALATTAVAVPQDDIIESVPGCGLPKDPTCPSGSHCRFSMANHMRACQPGLKLNDKCHFFGFKLVIPCGNGLYCHASLNEFFKIEYNCKQGLKLNGECGIGKTPCGNGLVCQSGKCVYEKPEKVYGNFYGPWF